MKTYIHATLAIGTAIFAFGCTETIDSQNLKTAGIAALIEATSTDGTSTTVIATLKTGGAQSNTYVDLSSGDAIFAEGDGKKVEMQAQSTGVYEAEFGTGAADTEFKVMLEREADDSAPNSAGRLPAPFEIDPIATADVSRAEDLTITWDPAGGSGDEVDIEVDGNCIFIDSWTVPDSGTHTIKAGDLKPTNSDMPESCSVEVEIRRTRSGSADPTFDSESWFRLHQVRTDSFTSAP